MSARGLAHFMLLSLLATGVVLLVRDYELPSSNSDAILDPYAKPILSPEEAVELAQNALPEDSNVLSSTAKLISRETLANDWFGDGATDWLPPAPIWLVGLRVSAMPLEASANGIVNDDRSVSGAFFAYDANYGDLIASGPMSGPPSNDSAYPAAASDDGWSFAQLAAIEDEDLPIAHATADPELAAELRAASLVPPTRVLPVAYATPTIDEERSALAESVPYCQTPGILPEDERIDPETLSVERYVPVHVFSDAYLSGEATENLDREILDSRYATQVGIVYREDELAYAIQIYRDDDGSWSVQCEHREFALDVSQMLDSERLVDAYMVHSWYIVGAEGMRNAGGSLFHEVEPGSSLAELQSIIVPSLRHVFGGNRR